MRAADQYPKAANIEEHCVGRGFFNTRREVTRAFHKERRVAGGVKAGVHASFPVEGFECEMGCRTITRADHCVNGETTQQTVRYLKTSGTAFNLDGGAGGRVAFFTD
jgi:hypothetical protein